MKTWLIAPWVSAHDLVALAKHADTLGFEGIMGADHGFIPQTMANGYLYTEDGRPPINGDMPYPDVWTSIAAMAMATKKLKFSTAVYVLPLRDPIEVAKATGTLALLSEDRLMLGVGVGWMKEEFDVYGVDFKTRGKRMDEMIDIMRKLWGGGYIEHHGDLFDFPPLQIAPMPGREIPILIGGDSSIALRRAARIGQGWIGVNSDFDDCRTKLIKLQDYRREYGRDKETFETVLPFSELNSTEKTAELQELGMTSVFFGFKDYTIPLADKLTKMEQYAHFCGLV